MIEQVINLVTQFLELAVMCLKGPCIIDAKEDGGGGEGGGRFEDDGMACWTYPDIPDRVISQAEGQEERASRAYHIPAHPTMPSLQQSKLCPMKGERQSWRIVCTCNADILTCSVATLQAPVDTS